MKKALLLKAGQVLSPDAFMLVLDSESANKGFTAFHWLGNLSWAADDQLSNFCNNDAGQLEQNMRT